MYVVPAEPALALAVFKLLTSVQLEPFQDSVLSQGIDYLQPKANAAVGCPVAAYQHL
jgi:hypothetical protein